MKSWKNLVLVSILCFSFFAIGNSSIDPIINRIGNSGTISMPIVQSSYKIVNNGLPVPHREEKYNKYLAPSLLIETPAGSGSGTICYYDGEWAYVISCGHLWSGTRTAEEIKKHPISCNMVSWYKNEQKTSRRSYKAEVLFYSNDRGYDCSLSRFKPDWSPNYFPIAPIDFKIPIGSTQNSVGCDGASEVALYEVEIVGYNKVDLVTKNNSPRPGRSGGGLLHDEGYFIAICWGTSSTDGSGVGYFTPLSSIHKMFAKNGYGWLLDISASGMARKLKILDVENPSRKVPGNSIPLPSAEKIPTPFSQKKDKYPDNHSDNNDSLNSHERDRTRISRSPNKPLKVPFPRLPEIR